MTVAETIRLEVLGWPGLRAGPHRFSGVEFRIDYDRLTASKTEGL